MLALAQATPPSIPNPTPGQQVPVGDLCPTCGVLKTFWLYNPFMRQTRQQRGWVLWRTQHCDCVSHPGPAPPYDPELADLDRLLNWEGSRHQTFASFCTRGRPKCLAAYQFCVHYARRSGVAEGLCLWGSPSLAREHLLAATVNAFRAQGIATALITFPHALELLAPPADVEAFRPARAALRRVPHLAISGLFADPATPVELKPLHQLLDHRLRHQRPTHFTAHRPPAYWRDGAIQHAHPIQAEIVLLVERLTLAPIPVPA